MFTKNWVFFVCVNECGNFSERVYSTSAVLARGRHSLWKTQKKKTYFLSNVKRSDTLQTLSLEPLRSYGRSLWLEAPTKLRKGVLITEILKVLCEERFPKRNKKGAPVKNQHIDEQIIKTLSRLKDRYFFEEEKPIGQGRSSEEGVKLSSSVVLHLTVTPELLNEQQKFLLNAFLNSLS